MILQYRQVLFTLGLAFLISACATHTHVIGNGPSSGLSEEARQYYALYGLVQLNKVDTGAMVGDAKDYKIETGTQAIDVVISAIAGSFTVTTRTVKVTK